MTDQLAAARAAPRKPRKPRPSMRKAIDNYCRWCIYDPLDKGTWRQQTGGCTTTDCPLYELRPQSSSARVVTVE